MSKHLHSTKVSLLADTKSEGMFYKSYATKQLLLLSGKAPMIVAKKKDTEPRLTEGLIVSTPVVRWVEKRIRCQNATDTLDGDCKRKRRNCLLISFFYQCENVGGDTSSIGKRLHRS